MGSSRLQEELQTDALQGNMGRSSCFKLKPVWQRNSFEEIDTLLLGLIELYNDAANLAFPSSIRYNLLS